MRYDEFKRRLGKAGLTVREFADLVGVSCNTVTNYASRNEVPSHLAVEVTLMSELAERDIDFKTPLNALTFKERKPQGAAAKGARGGSKQKTIFDD